MNPLNYASLEASRRLVKAGIVLETERVWRKNTSGEYYLSGNVTYNIKSQIPAPSMAEVWREWPESVVINGLLAFKTIQQTSFSFASYKSNDSESKVFKSTNPTDALIDLLIWVRNNK